MADLHPHPDELLDLGLGHLPEPDRGRAVDHLGRCDRCRAEYDALSAGLEQVLAATPRTDPPPGFDRAVLDAMDAARSPAPTPAGKAGSRPARPGQGASRRPAFALAAAALLGVVLGAGLTLSVMDRTEPDRLPQAPPVQASAVLTTGDGERVGTVTRSWLQGEPALVVAVTDGPPGNRYTCRLVLAGGERQVVGDWTIHADRPNSWVVQPATGVEAVELVGESGSIWSSADL